MVGVAGALARVGTMTQAIGLYHALKSIGFTPCLVDREQALVSALMRLYGENTAQREDTVSICGVEFSHDILSGTEYNAFVADCGLLEKSSAAAFGENALRFLCAGAKAWELPHLANTMQKPYAAIGQVIFFFASEHQQEQSAALLKGTVPPVMRRGSQIFGRRVKEKPPRHPGMEKWDFGDLLRSRVTIGVIYIVIAVLIAFVGVPVVERILSARAGGSGHAEIEKWTTTCWPPSSKA